MNNNFTFFFMNINNNNSLEFKIYYKLVENKIKNRNYMQNNSLGSKQWISNHLMINLLLIIYKISFQHKEYLQSLLLFFIKTSLCFKKSLSTKIIGEKNLNFSRLKWMNLIEIKEKKNILGKEINKEIAEQKNFNNKLPLKKKKFYLLKKFKKFYLKYLGIIINIKNNIMILNFLKPSNHVNLKFLKFTVVKNKKFFCLNFKILNSIKNFLYVKKNLKYKQSLCRALFFIKKQN